MTRAVISLKVNGQPLPQAIIQFERIEVVNNIFTVPCLRLTLRDNSALFSGPMALVDGTKLELSRGPNDQNLRTSTFSVIGTRSRDSDNTSRKVVIALLDVGGFFTDMPSFAQQGTSMSVASALCKKYGLDFGTNVEPDDAMRWTTFGRTPRQFLELIERRLWAGEKSFVQTAVTEDKKILMTNIIKKMEGEPSMKFTHNFNEKDAILVEELREKSISGVKNMYANYGTVTAATNHKGVVEKFDKAKLSAGGQVNISAEERQKITGTHYHFESNMPINDGPAANVHKHWVQAYDVWRRYFSLFSEFVRIRVNGSLKDLELLSCVELYSGTITAKGPVLVPKLSGKWIYAGYTELISGDKYMTAALLFRNFVGEKGNTELLSGAGGANKSINRQASVADDVRPPQTDDAVKQTSVGNAVDTLVQKQNAAVAKMTESFAKAADAIDVNGLSAKYGAQTDKLNALMSEFSAAALANRLCGLLSPLEKASFDFGLANPGTVLQMLDGRLGAIEGLLGTFTGDINQLIANGDIPDTYAELPRLNARCAQNQVSEMRDAVKDKLGNKCLSALTLDKLHGPSLDLESLYKLYEEYMRKYLCAFGGSTDGYELEAQ